MGKTSIAGIKDSIWVIVLFQREEAGLNRFQSDRNKKNINGHKQVSMNLKGLFNVFFSALKAFLWKSC